MKIQFLILFLVSCLVGSAWARLGETEEQLIERYGQVISRSNNSHVGAAKEPIVTALDFQKSGFRIFVILFNGVSSKEIIQKQTQDPMTDQEFKILLEANAQGKSWNDKPTVGDVTHQKILLREDGAEAKVGGPFKNFEITSKELIDAIAAAEKSAHATSLEGF